jgi:3-dehydroquinate dehydratase II
MKPIYILNGPNLNLLGYRQPEIYGGDTLADIHGRLETRGRDLGLAVEFRQTNHEGELVGWIQEARSQASAIIINAGAYTHTSVALLDALLASDLPVVEVHLSNIYKREPFRHKSFISPAAWGIICGVGPKGYELALDALAERLQSTPATLDV